MVQTLFNTMDVTVTLFMIVVITMEGVSANPLDVSENQIALSREKQNAVVNTTCPWTPAGFVYPPQAIDRLHIEIEQFFEYMQLSQEDRELRESTIDRIRSRVLDLWPDAQLFLHGSYESGFSIHRSDLDFVVNEVPVHSHEQRIEALKLFATNISDPSSWKIYHPTSRISYMRFIERNSKINIDMEINDEGLALKAVDFVKGFRRKYPDFKKIVVLLKEFLAELDLYGSAGEMKSYGIILTVINIFEMHPKAKEKDVNLGTLLLDYLELYGQKFDYENVGIRIASGRSEYIPRSELPCGLVNGRKPMFCIVDEVTPTDNALGPVIRSSEVKQAYQDAFIKLTEVMAMTTSNCILSHIINLPDDFIEKKKDKLMKY